ncbi:hypothetical protein ACIQH9_01555 [Pseudarthrobacter oxydans]|uniref:glycoside hydrolase family 78 protein n=1 Tax=Pseudarthrobacter oxydans TaxID=1671 RepID=UPI003818C737
MGNIRPLHLQRAGFLMRPQPATTPELATAIPKARGQLHAVNLLTEGLAECLTASLRPAFSWQLAQPDGSDPARALQTGYEVTVEDAQGLKFWSSGPVPSPAQRGVTYDGPALDGDTDYAWRVRVRDAAGMPGEWSTPKMFSTGLPDDSWQADWIRRAPGGRAPLEILNNALRVAGSPHLPVPCPPARTIRLEARVRPVMGWAGLILRSNGPGTGLLLELNTAGEVVIRHAPVWEIPAPAVPETAELARARADRGPGCPPGAAARQGPGARLLAGPAGHRRRQHHHRLPGRRGTA